MEDIDGGYVLQYMDKASMKVQVNIVWARAETKPFCW